MQFNEYLKTCREQQRYTQGELVQALYLHDIEAFEGLDTTTLSKWERNITKPKIGRQISILRYFQKRTQLALPCMEGYSADEAEKIICKVGMRNLLGKSKELILNFPAAAMTEEDLPVHQLRNTDILEKVIDIHITLDAELNHETTDVAAETVKTWALMPENTFFVCQYKEHFFGLLFTVRLKPKSFEKMMSGEMEERDLRAEDFASFEEQGSNYIFSFFAMNEKASAMLFIRYYAHLIANQKVIEEIGVTTMMEDAKKLIESLNLRFYANIPIRKRHELQSYRATLPDFLASEPVLKMILSKQECPEE